MTKYVLLSDIHGNADALDAVIEREGYMANYLVLGDLMGLLAQPGEVVALLRTLPNATVIAGNHDKALLHHGEGHVNSDSLSRFEYDRTMLDTSSNDREWLRSLPYMRVVQLGNNRVCLTHAYPWPEKASGYEQGNAGVRKSDVPQVASVVSDDYDYVFHGHTHEQYDLDCSQWGHDVHFVNPGSLGYGGDYSVVDCDSGTVQHRSIEYDNAALKEHIQSVLPDDCPSVYEWI